jgi:hypothetical protein
MTDRKMSKHFQFSHGMWLTTIQFEFADQIATVALQIGHQALQAAAPMTTRS